MLTVTDLKARQKLGAQIKKALDGRKQKWLAQKLGINDAHLSNKLSGVLPFSDQEIEDINILLSTEFENV